MVGFAPLPSLDAVARLGIQRDPGTRLEVEVGVNVGECPLVRTGFDAPVGINGPVEHVVHTAFPFGLQFVSQAQAQHVLAVHGIDRVVIGEIDRQQPQGRQLTVELRQLRRRLVRCGDKNVVDGRLDNVAQAVQVEEFAVRAIPGTRGLEGNLRAGVEHPALLFPIGHVQAVRLAVVVKRGDMRIAQLGNRARLAQEARSIIAFVGCEYGELNGYSAAQIGVFGYIDFAHATFAETGDNPIM